jgi:hypothetical protein
MDREQAQNFGRAMRRNEEGPAFVDMPSAVDIMHFFAEECEWRNQGYHGFDGEHGMWREGNDYCYGWVEAHVDHDIWHFFLLDIRTHLNDKETRDYLWVTFNIFDGESMECEWHNHPVSFGASHEEHLDRFQEGMKWFTSSILAKREELHGD